MTFAERVLEFNQSLYINPSDLPEGIEVMNPFQDPSVIELTGKFYRKFYSDERQRYMVIGINPGRFGGGTTGIPFTDPHKLKNFCGIEVDKLSPPELSADFIYQMIEAYGGPAKFFGKFYLTAVSPLGFVKVKNGKRINYNYYDSPDLFQAVKNFTVDCIRRQLGFGIHTNTCFCLGMGKNFSILTKLNQEHHFFEKIIPLSHPRFVMQYRRKQVEQHISEYLQAFGNVV